MSEMPAHLQHLNDEQLAAVTSITGPLLILAGAGSGKTRVLTRRIAHLLHEGVDQKSILAVTFTNKAASEMKERVYELAGESGRGIWVSTFHSSCCRILRQDIEHLGYTKRFAIYDDDDQRRLIKSIVKAFGYDPDHVDPRKISGQIDHYKNQGYTAEKMLAEFRNYANSPLIKIWHDYERQLRAADALDFNDLLGKVVQLFMEHPSVLDQWRARFHYILVDEYQDTNVTQYRLLRLLADEHQNIAVVGDDDQSIYAFRGADISNILNFKSDFPGAKEVRLEQNYRSTGNILEVANSVVSLNPGRIVKKLWTSSGAGDTVALRCSKTPEDEADFVRRAIGLFVGRGYKHADIAIVYRTNATSRPFESALKSGHIPYRIFGGKKFYDRREVRDILCYLRLLVNPADDAAFLRIVNVPTRGVGAKTLIALRESATTQGSPLLEAARTFTGGSSRGVKGLNHFVSIIDDLNEQATVLRLEHLVTQVLENSGYRAMLQMAMAEGKQSKSRKQDANEAAGRLDNLTHLVRDAMTFVPPNGVTTSLDTLTSWLDRISLAGQADEVPDGGEVTLMTVHSSKGLEFPIIFAVQFMEGLFPHSRSLDEKNGVEEERRLAYVAFTRAQERLIITRSETIAKLGRNGIERTPAEPSRFIFGLPKTAIDGADPDGNLSEESAENDRQVTFIDIESMEQLQEHTAVHHATLGFGNIQRVHRSGTIFVDFEGIIRPVSPRDLKLVVE
jgi:DNA helicase-2/ATP-dependent DNA helicase PcrA